MNDEQTTQDLLNEKVKDAAPDQVSVPTSIGDILAKKRQELGLKVEEVSANLNLSNATIRVLEENRFKDIPNVLFCQGYLRNYANFLELDANALVEELNKQLNIKSIRPPQLQGVRKIKPVKVESDDKFKKVLVFAILPVAVFFITYQLFSYRAESNQSQQEGLYDTPSEHLEDLVLEEGDALNLETSTAANGDTGVAVSATITGLEADGLHSATIVGQLAGQSLTGQSTIISSNSVGQSIDQQMPSQAATRNHNMNAATAPVATDTLAAGVQSAVVESVKTGAKLDSLIIQYVEDAWTEVYDANDKRLLYSNKLAGDRLELTGQAPFYMKLGRPTAAVIYLNGRVVSIKTDRINSPISFVLE